MPPQNRKFRWGIVGTGQIAGDFAVELKKAEGAELYAVASRSKSSAAEFSRRHRIKTAYGSYEDFLANDNLDIVYIATPSNLHSDHCLMCLDAGKPLLCEKPFATNASDAKRVVKAAKEKGLFCMEAMWMRFNPLIQKTRDMVKNNELGDISYMRAEVGYRKSEKRLLDPAAGRGALLDFGVYAISLAYFLFGQPAQILTQAKIHASGVDETFSAILRYQTMAAVIAASVRGTMSNEALIAGSKKRIQIGPPLFNPPSMRIVKEADSSGKYNPNGKLRRAIRQIPYLDLLRDSFAADLLRGRGNRISRPGEGNGLRLEAEEVMRCLQMGQTESQVMPLSETVQILETADTMRSAWSC